MASRRDLGGYVLAALLAAGSTAGVAAPAPVPPQVTSPEPGALLAEADRLRTRDPKHFQAVLARAERIQHRMTPDQIDHVRFLQAYRGALQGRYRESLVVAKQLAGSAHDPAMRYRASVLVATLGALTRDYVDAMRHLSIALELAPGIEDETLRDHASAAAGALYNELEQYPRALEHAARILERTRDPRARCAAHEARTRAHAATADAGVDKYFAEGIAACTAAADAVGTALVRSNYGRYLLRTGRSAEAVRVLESTIAPAEATGYTRLIGDLNATLALAYQESGDLGGAEAAARRAVAGSGPYPHWRPLVIAHQVLYEIAEGRGDYRKAFEHFHRHHVAQRADLDEIKARELAVRLTEQDDLVRAQKARELEQRNRILLLQQREGEAQARALRLAVLCMGLLIMALGYWAWQSRRTQRMLRRLNETDVLTGIASRRHFAAQAERALAECERQGAPVAVLLLDLDHFKRINDECGHAVGDWVLREVARTGQAHVGPRDIFGRIGGEEFALLLPGRDALQAHAVAEALRCALRAIDGYAGGCHLPIAASIGIADAARSGYGYQRLLGDADRAMYAAKTQGRNRTVRAGSVAHELPACA